ncbi:MAG: beta strand repeat-containing protein, partial [Ilumatobacteraceae bacterium]
AGATLSTGGVLSGTVATASSSAFTVRVTDAGGRTDDQDLTLVAVNPVSITTASLPAATVDAAYSTTLVAAGGSGTYTWTATGVPAGMSLSSTGVLSGTPTAAATSSISFTVSDNGTPVRTSTRSLSLVVSTSLVVTTASLNSVVAGSAFSFTLASTGGSGTKTWSIASGSLPAGATLSTGGVLSGTVATAGSSAFTVRVTDAGSRTDDQDLTLLVVNPISITTASMPEGTVDAVYGATIAATGGSGTYAWSATGLPVGLAIDPSTGAVSGTPTAAGTSVVSVTVTDSGTPVRSATRSLSIVVVAALAVSTATLPNATQGTSYAATLASTGGSGTKTWSITGGALPAGLSMSAAGTISGTPSAGGTFLFTVTVADAGGRTASRALSISVASLATVKVGSLSIVKRVSKSGISGSVTVTVVNASGAIVASVSVTGLWTVSGITGSTSRTGLTSSRGTVTLTSPTYTAITGRTVQFCVTSLVRSGFTFDTSGPSCASFIA